MTLRDMLKSIAILYTYLTNFPSYIIIICVVYSLEILLITITKGEYSEGRNFRAWPTYILNWRNFQLKLKDPLKFDICMQRERYQVAMHFPCMHACMH